MKIYIAGKVTGLETEKVFKKFQKAFKHLQNQGHSVMTPDVLCEFTGFEHEDYMHVCYAMIDRCDAVYMLSDWQQSKGARMELQYAADHQKAIIYEDEATKEENFPILYGHPKAKAV